MTLCKCTVNYRHHLLCCCSEASQELLPSPSLRCHSGGSADDERVTKPHRDHRDHAALGSLRVLANMTHDERRRRQGGRRLRADRRQRMTMRIMEVCMVCSC